MPVLYTGIMINTSHFLIHLMGLQPVVMHHTREAHAHHREHVHVAKESGDILLRFGGS